MNRSPARGRLALFLLAAGVVAAVASIGLHEWSAALPAGIEATYVGTERCARCHQAEYDKWKGSHHDRAMEPAGPETVLGDFSDSVFELDGTKTRFFQKEGKYFVETAGRGGATETFHLPYTFGVEPLQQYLAEFPDGRFQALPIAWDTHKQCWFHLYETEKLAPAEWLYWTNWGMTWNHQCASCHSTNLQKNFDPASNSYHTTWSEIDVGCEACHGPGSVHLEVVARGGWLPDFRYGSGLASLKGKANAQRQLDACAPCHARRLERHPGFRPGDSFVDFYHPELLNTPAYYPDGQIRDENYEYGSFHLSLMHAKGVRCSDCHDPHSCRVHEQGNQLCLRCHVAGKYDTPSHHFHGVGSKGAECVSCHMPVTNYMRVDPRRDHSFRVPRPDLTISLGIPNACNRCHEDKSAQWSRDAVVRWYGEHDWPKRSDFAATIAAGREQDATAAKPLARLARDQSLPALLRASSFALLGDLPNQEVRGELEAGFEDPDVLVRTQALLALEPLLGAGNPTGANPNVSPNAPATGGAGGTVDRKLAAKMAARLTDESRTVRTEAARVLATVPRTDLPAESRPAFDAALAECLADLEFQRDTPPGNFNLGNLYASLRQPAKAEEAYLAALKLDPSYNLARFNLALLLYGQGRSADAAKTFAAVLEWTERGLGNQDPAVAQWNRSLAARTHFHLGLLEAESGEEGNGNGGLTRAARHLESAIELDPTAHRAHYNLGLARQQLGDASAAERSLRAALAASPDEADYLYALAVFYVQRDRPDDARPLLRALVQRRPTHLDAQMLLERINRPQ